jgi:hypothetical protein
MPKTKTLSKPVTVKPAAAKSANKVATAAKDERSGKRVISAPLAKTVPSKSQRVTALPKPSTKTLPGKVLPGKTLADQVSLPAEKKNAKITRKSALVKTPSAVAALPWPQAMSAGGAVTAHAAGSVQGKKNKPLVNNPAMRVEVSNKVTGPIKHGPPMASAAPAVQAVGKAVSTVVDQQVRLCQTLLRFSPLGLAIQGQSLLWDAMRGARPNAKPVRSK